MIDPESVGAAVSAAVATGKAGKGLARLLGPSADEVAEALRRWTAYRVGNAQKIAEVAARKSTAASDDYVVSPRVALRLLDEGSYSDDEIVVDYLGGVLASSRSPSGEDDNGVGWTALISCLPSDALRLHYLLYSCARRHLPIVSPSPDKPIQAAWCEEGLFLSWEELASFFYNEDDEDGERFGSRVLVALYALHREGLIDDNWATGPASNLRSVRNGADKDFGNGGVAYVPTRHGILLYQWGIGLGRQPIQRFLDSEPPSEGLFELPANFGTAISAMPSGSTPSDDTTTSGSISEAESR